MKVGDLVYGRYYRLEDENTAVGVEVVYLGTNFCGDKYVFAKVEDYKKYTTDEEQIHKLSVGLDEECVRNYIKPYHIEHKAEAPQEEVEEVPQAEQKIDVVNHPPHYEGGMECIDAMELAYGTWAVANFCQCSWWKYQWRAGRKDGNSKEQDLAKAKWYAKKHGELMHKIKKGEEILTWGYPMDIAQSISEGKSLNL